MRTVLAYFSATTAPFTGSTTALLYEIISRFLHPQIEPQVRQDFIECISRMTKMSSYFTNAFAFINANSIKTNVCGVWRNGLAMRMSSSESSTSITGGISRLDTLQTMISITGQFVS